MQLEGCLVFGGRNNQKWIFCTIFWNCLINSSSPSKLSWWSIIEPLSYKKSHLFTPDISVVALYKPAENVSTYGPRWLTAVALQIGHPFLIYLKVSTANVFAITFKSLSAGLQLLRHYCKYTSAHNVGVYRWKVPIASTDSADCWLVIPFLYYSGKIHFESVPKWLMQGQAEKTYWKTEQVSKMMWLLTWFGGHERGPIRRDLLFLSGNYCSQVIVSCTYTKHSLIFNLNSWNS